MAAPAQIHCLSLCAGAGGLDIAVQLAFEVLGLHARSVCYVEREAYAAATLVARMEDAALDDAPVWDDLGTFDGSPWRGRVDCLLAGYPCQPFSCAGKRLAEKDPRHLWPEVDRIIGEAQPWLVILENVSAHLRLGFGIVRRDLQRRGYVVAAGLFTASEVGASHERERLVIVAYRAERGLGELRESSGRSGFVKRGDQALADGEGGRDGAIPEGQWHQGQGTPEPNRLVDALPLFPPGPGDLDGWGEVLRIDPSLEPALCGMADGLASGVDRLRLTGNGVVPLQIAYAILTLGAAEAALS